MWQLNKSMSELNTEASMQVPGSFTLYLFDLVCILRVLASWHVPEQDHRSYMYV